MSDFDPYDSLVPLFLHTEIPNRVRQIGSGIFFEFHGRPFLLTAAHVTDELREGELLVPTSAGLLPIMGYLAYIDLPPEISRNSDTTDIAYYRLNPEFATILCHHFRPLPQARSELITSALDLTTCSASGYPASKGKNTGDTLSSEIYSFRGVAAPIGVYEKYGLEPNSSIIIQFNKKKSVHHDTLKPFIPPSLKGVSGGAIFAWPKGHEVSQDWSLPRFVGIVHSYKEREGLIIGTSFLPILAAISLGQMKRFGGLG